MTQTPRRSTKSIEGFGLGLLCLLALTFASCSSIPHGGPDAPRAERPTYTIGEKWIRSDGAYELIRIDNDRYIFSAGPDREIHLTKEPRENK